MEGTPGSEPGTSRSEVECFTTELYPLIFYSLLSLYGEDFFSVGTQILLEQKPIGNDFVKLGVGKNVILTISNKLYAFKPSVHLFHINTFCALFDEDMYRTIHFFYRLSSFVNIYLVEFGFENFCRLL